MAPETRSPAPAVAAGNGAYPETHQGIEDGAEHRTGESKPLVAFQIADTLMNSGLVGVDLSKLLRELFLGVTWGELSLAVAIFATAMHSELLGVEVELQALRAELASLRRRG